MKQHHLLIIFILFISACHEETNDGRELRVTQSSGSISIQNQTKSITYYMLVDSDLASVINWAPTLDEKQSIPSKASVLIKLDSISGYSNTSTALSLSYWQAVKENGNSTPGQVQSQTIALIGLY